MLIVGLTGGIATGKSTVSSLLVAHGIPVVDADALSRQVVVPGTRGHSRIVAEFGRDILQADGSLDRTKLGDIIFNDEVKRKKLNSIVHPAVFWAMVWRVLKYWVFAHKLCVLDVPLLIESGMYRWVDKVVVVYCEKEVQLERLMRRDGSTEQAASARLNAQMPVSEKLDLADHVVDNTGSLDHIKVEVTDLVKTLEGEAGRWWWLLRFIPPLGLFTGLLGSRQKNK